MACITSANGGTTPVIIIRRGARYASRADGEAWHDLPRNGDHAAAAEFQLDGIAGGIVARVDNRGRILGASVAAGAGTSEAFTVFRGHNSGGHGASPIRT
ncbi:MAG: hypothetical protein KA371_17250 [Acidobacteria bacterium]|mgnify:CR=1 FL=1|nr:hypothetical protein [Acidobacteriota bacterium]